MSSTSAYSFVRKKNLKKKPRIVGRIVIFNDVQTNASLQEHVLEC